MNISRAVVSAAEKERYRMAHIPYIEGTGRLATLYVDGKPFHIRGGELHNSSASDLRYMEERVWTALRPLGLNGVIAPVYWECLEPEEGKFDFELVDGLIAQARREGMKLVLLWFGLWKNGASTYIPLWAKNDPERFGIVRNAGDRPLGYMGGLWDPTVSPLCRDAVAADARAFAALMAHLRDTDDERTVVMIQAENEIGVVGAARDYSERAEAAFAEEIPAALAETFGVHGTWSEAFGTDAAETFMAWHYACAVETIVSAGKAEYPLPVYVNAWLEQAPGVPGTYPSGGPQFKMHRVWRAAAPHVDLYAPDIYVPNFRDVCDEYASDGNPLFIPEARGPVDAVANFLYAVGEHNAICFAPFGIEDVAGRAEELDPQVLAQLNISPEAMGVAADGARLLGGVYGAVGGMEDVIEKAHREGKIHGFLDNGNASEIIDLENIRLRISYGSPFGGAKHAAGGLVIELGDYELLVLACGCAVEFEAPEHTGMKLDLLRKEEGRFEDGKWVRGRILNGDERYRNTFGKEAQLQRFMFRAYR